MRNKIVTILLLTILLSTKLLYADNLVKRAQTYLTMSGFDIGKVDGIIGPKTVKGLREVYNSSEIYKNYKISESDIVKLRNIYFKKKFEIWTKLNHLNKQMSISDARHLLERVGIGANYLQILKYSKLKRSEAILKILMNFNSNLSIKPPNFVYDDLPEYWIRWDYDESDRQSFRVARDNEIHLFKKWWVKEMISTPYPQNDRLVLFWTNHFPVEYSSINEESISIARQHFMFRENGFGNFKSLLKKIIRDPAMLNYLDSNESEEGAPNENLGRELMELFVLGEGNYTEQAVKEASRTLTGYKYNRLRNFEVNFHKDHWAHDKKQKLLFGKKGNFDGDDLIDILFLQPEASIFLTKKFWSYYISEAFEDKEEIERLAFEFKNSDFEIPILLSEIIASKSFWDKKYRGTIIKSPVDLVIGTIRTTGFLPKDWQSIPGALANLGQNLFEPPNVAGWPRGSYWITPARLLNRNRFMQKFFDKEGASLEDLEINNPEIKMFKKDNIILRYGAENFRGSPKYKISLINHQVEPYQNEQKWVSPVITARNGHDTELYGRISRQEIPWTIDTFDLDPQIKFNKVAVHFVNDHCCGPGGADGGDRNFFLDWIKIGQHLLLAENGIQRSGCPNNNNPGFLYCSGNIVMDINDSIKIDDQNNKNELKIKKNQLALERIAFEWGKKYKQNKKWNELNLSLFNVKFNSHYETGIKLKIVHEFNKDFKIIISSDNCSKKCISGNWPKSSFFWENGKIKVLEFSIGPKENSIQKKQFKELDDLDKKFVVALWRAIPVFLEKMQEGRNFKDRNGKEILLSWKDALNKMFLRLEKSKYAINYNFPEVVFIKDNFKKSKGMMSMAMSSVNENVPIPASLNLNKDAKEWELNISNSIGFFNLKSAVLANDPIESISDHSKPTNLIKNPVFNLK